MQGHIGLYWVIPVKNQNFHHKGLGGHRVEKAGEVFILFFEPLIYYLLTHVTQPRKFNHQPHEKHELFVRNSALFVMLVWFVVNSLLISKALRKVNYNAPSGEYPGVRGLYGIC
jgi:hypothetical protein